MIPIMPMTFMRERINHITIINCTVGVVEKQTSECETLA